MYNLLISAAAGVWEQSPAIFPLERLFEYTEKSIVEELGGRDDPNWTKLKYLPCIFAYESPVQCNARIGEIKRLRTRTKEIRIEFEFYDNLPEIPFEKLEQFAWELDIGEWELNRTHWALKDIDLFKELVDAKLISRSQLSLSTSTDSISTEQHRQVEIRPTVFDVPEGGIENDLVAVMRPFKPQFEPVQRALEKICGEFNLRCCDVSKVWNESEIIQDVFSLIYRSIFVICDFSKGNPNVFYEAGIAHTLGKTVIPIVQDPKDIPFDLGHHRYLQYLPTEQGLNELATGIAPRIGSLIARLS